MYEVSYTRVSVMYEVSPGALADTGTGEEIVSNYETIYI